MQSVYETPRLKLVASAPGLAERVSAYYQANRDFLAAFEPEREDVFFTVSAQKRLLLDDSLAAGRRTGFRFWLVPKAGSERIIGTAAMTSIVWGAFMSCFMGYSWIRGT